VPSTSLTALYMHMRSKRGHDGYVRPLCMHACWGVCSATRPVAPRSWCAAELEACCSAGDPVAWDTCGGIAGE
jgi:hypothetical protein